MHWENLDKLPGKMVLENAFKNAELKKIELNAMK